MTVPWEVGFYESFSADLHLKPEKFRNLHHRRRRRRRRRRCRHRLRRYCRLEVHETNKAALQL